MYTPTSEYEPRVPTKVIKAVVAKATKEPTDSGTLLMNTQFSSPVIFQFTPSAVEFDEIKIPQSITLQSIKVI